MKFYFGMITVMWIMLLARVYSIRSLCGPGKLLIDCSSAQGGVPVKASTLQFVMAKDGIDLAGFRVFVCGWILEGRFGAWSGGLGAGQ